MILVPRKNLYLPERFRSKESQRGSIIIAQQGSAAATGAETVILSGATISDADAPGPIETRVRFNNDGTVDRYLSSVGSYAQLSSATDWVRPDPPGAAGDYEIWVEEFSYTGPSARTGTMDTWEALSTTREWTLTRQAVSGSGTTTWALDIKIRMSASPFTELTSLVRYTLNSQIL